MNHYKQLKSIIIGLEEDFEKFYDKKNSAAGTRVRKGMQDLKVLSQEVRTYVQDEKNKEKEKQDKEKKGK